MWTLRLPRRPLLQREPRELLPRQALLPLIALGIAVGACQPASGRAAVSAEEPRLELAPRVDEEARSTPDSAPAEPAEASATDAAAPTDASGFELVPLPVPGFLDAVVALPRATAPRPLLVATHGAGGDPEWPCHSWAERVRAERVVLCPRGKALSLREDSGFYYPDHRALGAELLAALDALRSVHGARVSEGPALYAAYSQGASMGALFLADHGKTFPALILTEGGAREWSASSARRYKESGGKRVLFVCGGKACRDSANASARWLEKAGVATRVEHVPRGGHTDAGAVGRRLDETYRWALEE